MVQATPEHNTSVSSFREYRAPRWLIELLGDKTHGQPHVRTLHPPRRGPRSWRTRFSCFGGPFRCSNNCDTNEHAARWSRGISPIELGCKHLYLKLTRFTGDDFTPRRRPSTTSAGASLQPRSHLSLPSRPLTSLSFVRQWHLPAAFRMHSARHQPGEQGKSQCYNLVEALPCLCSMLHFRCCS